MQLTQYAQSRYFLWPQFAPRQNRKGIISQETLNTTQQTGGMLFFPRLSFACYERPVLVQSHKNSDTKNAEYWNQIGFIYSEIIHTLSMLLSKWQYVAYY